MTPVGFDRVTFSDGFWQKYAPKTLQFPLKTFIAVLKKRGVLPLCAVKSRKSRRTFFTTRTLPSGWKGQRIYSGNFPTRRCAALLTKR